MKKEIPKNNSKKIKKKTKKLNLIDILKGNSSVLEKVNKIRNFDI